MKKLFTIVGMLTLIGGLLLAMLMLPEPLMALCVAASSILSGSLLLAVADLLGRVDYLERKLGLYASEADADAHDLPQKKCPKCGRSIDFDYEICPYCSEKL